MALIPNSNFSNDNESFNSIYGINTTQPLSYDSFSNTISITGISGVVHTLTEATGDQLCTALGTKQYIDYFIQGIEWQKHINNVFDPTSGLPINPTNGDRYISLETANGWTVDYIYEYVIDTWVESIPRTGWSLWNKGNNVIYAYNTNRWVEIMGGMATDKKKQTEYMLIGTMASYLIALLIGLIGYKIRGWI